MFFGSAAIILPAVPSRKQAHPGPPAGRDLVMTAGRTRKTPPKDTELRHLATISGDYAAQTRDPAKLRDYVG
jgi:hypothetical protein